MNNYDFCTCIIIIIQCMKLLNLGFAHHNFKLLFSSYMCRAHFAGSISSCYNDVTDLMPHDVEKECSILELYHITTCILIWS